MGVTWGGSLVSVGGVYFTRRLRIEGSLTVPEGKIKGDGKFHGEF